MSNTRFVLRAIPTEKGAEDPLDTQTVEPMNMRNRRRAAPTARSSYHLRARDETAEQLATNPHQIIGSIEEPLPLSLIEPFRYEDQTDVQRVVEQAKQAKASWGLSALGLGENDAFDGRGVTIAVLDTGIDKQHPAFDGMNIVEEDFTGTGLGDTHGHGTHCAGTIFGRDVDDGDGRPVRIGVARGVETALIGKVIGGKAGLKELIRALDWAFDNGADIIAMSLGFNIYRELEFKDADLLTAARLVNTFRDNVRLFDSYIEYRSAREREGQRALVFAATGNVDKRVSKLSPAAAIGILSVGACEPEGDRFKVADFSNSEPDLVGPGVGIISAAAGGGFAVMDGTSQACPHVAGLAALHWQQVAESTGGTEEVSAQIVAASLRASAARTRRQRFPDASGSDIGAGMPGVP